MPIPIHLEMTATAASGFFERRLSVITVPSDHRRPRTPSLPVESREAIRIPQPLLSQRSPSHPNRMANSNRIRNAESLRHAQLCELFSALFAHTTSRTETRFPNWPI